MRQEPTGEYGKFIEEWTVLRLESPYRLMGRLDDASKQLISVAGVLEGVYIAAFAFGDSLAGAPVWIGGVLMIPLVLVIFFAAKCICEVPPGAEAMAAFELLKRGTEVGWDSWWLRREVDKWCQGVDSIAAKKRRFLHLANVSLVLAALGAVVAFVALMIGSPSSTGMSG